MLKRTLHKRQDRSGAAAVEMALVLPVFFLFMFALIEFGHAFMVVNTLNAAAKQAARLGIAEGVTTADVEAKLEAILSKAFDTTHATVMVKNASVFDTSTVNPSTLNYSSLPDMDLSIAEARQLFIVRIEVPYDNVALMTPFWVKNITLYGQSVQRHE